MALLFSFSLAMDKFVIGRVVTAIGYPSIQFSIRLVVATALTTQLISFAMAVLSWQHSMPRGCADSMRVRNWTFVSVRRNQRQRVSRSDKSCARGALVAPIDTKVSIDTIVQ
jgi:hypothetical protein